MGTWENARLCGGCPRSVGGSLKQHAAVWSAEAEAVAGGADSVWQVPGSQLAGPGKTCATSRTRVASKLTRSCVFSQHKSSKSHGNTQLGTAGVLTKMQRCSGAGPCTLVGTLFSPIFAFLFDFISRLGVIIAPVLICE